MSSHRRRLREARGRPGPTFTNGWSRRACTVSRKKQHTRKWPNCTGHHESAHQNFQLLLGATESSHLTYTISNKTCTDKRTCVLRANDHYIHSDATRALPSAIGDNHGPRSVVSVVMTSKEKGLGRRVVAQCCEAPQSLTWIRSIRGLDWVGTAWEDCDPDF